MITFLEVWPDYIIIYAVFSSNHNVESCVYIYLKCYKGMSMWVHI